MNWSPIESERRCGSQLPRELFQRQFHQRGPIRKNVDFQNEVPKRWFRAHYLGGGLAWLCLSFPLSSLHPFPPFIPSSFPRCKLRKPKVVSEVLKELRRWIGPRLRVRGGVIPNFPGSFFKDYFINGDLYQKMLILKMKFTNVGFVSIIFVVEAPRTTAGTDVHPQLHKLQLQWSHLMQVLPYHLVSKRQA